jgi:Holliday junction resolvasome RuvABC endonuclease subunit
MRIMGLDLSMTATGVAFPDGSTAVIKPSGEGDARLLSIEAWTDKAIAVARPQLAVIEQFGAFQGSAARTVPMVHAVVRMRLMHAGIPYVLFTPQTLKTFATGRHTADKAAMMLAAFKRMGREFTDDNECDAAWLRAAGHYAYGEPVVDLPKSHTEALHKVIWPRIAGAGEPITHVAAKKPTRRRRAVAA